jgi:DNA-binding CsgD family transcriptional regulator
MASDQFGQRATTSAFGDLLRRLRTAAELTQEELAERASVSPRTVMAHDANIFGKLGVNARRDAAAYAVRHGLV